MRFPTYWRATCRSNEAFIRILIIAPGSRGDVQPYLALGKGLLNAGNEVRFVTHQNFGPLVAEHGLSFHAVEGDVQDIVQSERMRARVEGGNFLRLMAQMAKEARRGALLLAESALEAARGIDLLVAGLGGIYTGLAVAEKLDLPLLQAYLVPFTPTRHFPSVLAPRLPDWFAGLAYRLSHQLTRQVMWQGFRAADTLARRKLLDIPVAPLWGPYNAKPTQGLPVLYGFSPAVIPPPPDWGESIKVTGYWFLEAVENWQPPSDLLDFLAAGDPPVYIGFGSMSNREPEEVTRLVFQALDQANQRAVLLSGWGGLSQLDLPDSTYMIDAIPHSWLFPRMAAIVHHGGAGTTAASLQAGVPTVVVPFFGDQPFWGQRVADMGVGPPPIPRRQLTADRLARAIQTAVTDGVMRQRAAILGDNIRGELGIARAVEIITRVEIGEPG